MSIPACFSSLLGYSRKEDVCNFDSWDDAYGVSDSGLYIDELPGLPQRFIASFGGSYDTWEKFYNSIDNAVKTFQVDVLAEILKYKTPARRRFYGDIGGKSFTTALGSCGTYHGLRMYTDIKGGTFTLRAITLILNVTEAVTLQIYDEYDLLYTYALTSTAGKPTKTTIAPLELDTDRNYYFLYTTTGSPYNNKLTCNCGSFHWCFCLENPCFGPSRDAWTEWAMVGGVCGDTLSERDDWGTSRDAQGMILHGNFGCDILGTLCDEDYSDWTGNEVDLAIAHAIWYKTGEYLTAYIMDSEEVSRRVLLGTEQWAANITYYATRYKDMLAFIAENFEDERNECLKCKDPHGITMRSQVL